MITPQTLAERRDFLERCTRCSQCKFVPTPKSQRHASACPSMDYGQFHAFSGGGQLIMGYGLLNGDIDCSEELVTAVSSCTMCGSCDVSCKVNFSETVEPLDSLYAIRAKIVEQGHSPAAHKTLMENMRATGNAEGYPRVERELWASGLDLPLAREARSDVLLHIGSKLAYDPLRRTALRTVVKALKASGVSLSHMGGNEGSCGGLAFDLGYTQDAAAFAGSLLEQVKHSGASTLVTFSSAAYAAFRAIYPRLGYSFDKVRVLHYTEYLQELVQSKRLVLRRLKAEQVAYHDSCKLGRLSEVWKPHDLQLDNRMGGILVSRAPQALRFGHGGCYDAPRALLRYMGLDVVEMERKRAASYCCGASGGVTATLPEAAELAAANVLAEFVDTQAPTLISACSGCTSHLGRNNSGEEQVRDLIDLLALALEPVLAPSL